MSAVDEIPWSGVDVLDVHGFGATRKMLPLGPRNLKPFINSSMILHRLLMCYCTLTDVCAGVRAFAARTLLGEASLATVRVILRHLYFS